MPDGKPYTDEFFGEMHIYRNEAAIRIALVDRPPGGGMLDLEIRSQGCADIGLCYPPQVWTASVDGPGGRDGPGPGASKLSRLMGNPQAAVSVLNDEPLPPEQAFPAIIDVADHR